MLTRLQRSCIRYVGRRHLITWSQASRLGRILSGDEATRAEVLEEHKKHSTEMLKDGFNSVFKHLDVHLEVAAPPGRCSSMAFGHDLSESDLRNRLADLRAEVDHIERRLATDFTPSKPSEHIPSNSLDSNVASPSSSTLQKLHEVTNISPDAGACIDTSEGENYDEPDALTRRLKKWFTVDTCTEIPYQMMSTFELYPQWMPWCKSGAILASHPSKGTTACSVGFGINVPFLGFIGDNIEYRVELEPPSKPHGHARVCTISDQSRYMQKLVYDWRFIPIDDLRTKVVLDLEFKGAGRWCMPIWESLRRDVIDGVAGAFVDRVMALQAAAGEKKGQQTMGLELTRLSDVLQGPFRHDEAVVVTESNGRTIRHANVAFASLAGRSKQSLEGRDIPDLLQTPDTDRDVLRGLGTAIRAKLPAKAIVSNKNSSGENFLNQLTLAPLYDDERNSGVVFWAVLKIVQGKSQQLEFSKLCVLNDAWGPDYQHPAAISGKDLYF